MKKNLYKTQTRQELALTSDSEPFDARYKEVS
jgi:hypothetical protein